jgi:hypothetical protein
LEANLTDCIAFPRSKISALRQITDPKITNPKITNPKITNPKITNPKITNPKITNPKFTDPKIVDLKITDPKIANPKNYQTSSYRLLQKKKTFYRPPSYRSLQFGDISNYRPVNLLNRQMVKFRSYFIVTGPLRVGERTQRQNFKKEFQQAPSLASMFVAYLDKCVDSI